MTPKDTLIETMNEKREGVTYKYTTCVNNGCWDATCVLKCGIKDGKIISIEADDTVNPGDPREKVDENRLQQGMLQARPCPMGHAWRQDTPSSHKSSSTDSAPRTRQP